MKPVVKESLTTHLTLVHSASPEECERIDRKRYEDELRDRIFTLMLEADKAGWLE